MLGAVWRKEFITIYLVPVPIPPNDVGGDAGLPQVATAACLAPAGRGQLQQQVVVTTCRATTGPPRAVASLYCGTGRAVCLGGLRWVSRRQLCVAAFALQEAARQPIPVLVQDGGVQLIPRSLDPGELSVGGGRSAFDAQAHLVPIL